MDKRIETAAKNVGASAGSLKPSVASLCARALVLRM